MSAPRPPYRLGGMPLWRPMTTLDERVVAASPRAVFEVVEERLLQDYPAGDRSYGDFWRAGQAGGDHAGVVVDQQIAGVQQAGQIADMAVHQRLAHVQQARGIARPRRFIGDQLGRQLEVKISGSHEERRYSPSVLLGKGE